MTNATARRSLGSRLTASVLVLAALGLALVLARGETESTGPYIVPTEAKIQISYDGACGPVKLNTAILDSDSVTPGQPKPIDVGSGSGAIAGCIGTQTDPGTVKIDDELFDYQNLSTYTADNGGVLPQSPFVAFNLLVETTNMGTGPLAFPSSGYLYVGGERMHYNTRTTNSFQIDARDTISATHPSHSYVRAERKLILIGRRQPTYNSGWNAATPGLPPGATGLQSHSPGTTVVDPMTNLTCRGRFSQTVVASANDPVTLRYRCYTHLVGPWPDVDYTTPPYLQSAPPSTGIPLALTPVLHHGTATGSLNEATGVLTLNTEVFGLTCIPFVAGHLWVRITQVIGLDKAAGPPDTDLGTFSMFAYENDQCTGPPIATLGNDMGNATYSTTDAPSSPPPGTPTPAPSYDSDKDGCSDFRELGTSETAGGKRDPFNPFDIGDINHDGAVSAGTDVLGIAQAFGGATGARYVPYKDRGVRVPDGADGIDDPANPFDGDGPNIWNTRSPNSNINSGGDVLGAAQQFGQPCLHAVHPLYVPYGPHPTTLTQSVSNAAAPIVINVARTSGFSYPTGQLLIDSETLTYNQGSSCPGFTDALTQFCITARGSGSPAGNLPAPHTGNPSGTGAIVYQK